MNDSQVALPAISLPVVMPHPWLGTFCGLVAAVVYTASNAFLRSVSNCDPIWVSAMKAVPTAALMAPWLLISLRRGEGIPPPVIWLMIAAASLVGQLGGNISFQIALGQIGLALTVPLSLGGMIVGSTVLSRVFLHERLNLAAVLAVGILLIAIGVLSFGADEARQKLLLHASADPWQLALGVLTASLSGVAYAVLNVVIRYSIQRGATLPATLLTVSVMGLISLSLIAWGRIGFAGMLATTPRDLAMMLLAGVCNAGAFVALTRCLQLTSVVYANVLNAGQAALAAVTGVIVFSEPASAGMVGGVLLTVVGLFVLTWRPHESPAVAKR